MERQYVGIDRHRPSATIHRMAPDGEVLATSKIVAQPCELAQVMAEAGPEPEVVLEWCEEVAGREGPGTAAP